MESPSNNEKFIKNYNQRQGMNTWQIIEPYKNNNKLHLHQTPPLKKTKLYVNITNILSFKMSL